VFAADIERRMEINLSCIGANSEDIFAKDAFNSSRTIQQVPILFSSNVNT
jgi:hypothetical protein